MWNVDVLQKGIDNIDASVVFLVMKVLLRVKLMNSVRFNLHILLMHLNMKDTHPHPCDTGLIPLSEPCNTVHVLLLKHSDKKYPTIQRHSILSG